MSTTVLAPSGLEISSSDSTPEEMLESLARPDKDRKPRVLVDKGKPVKAKPAADDDDDEGDTSKAASVLGKKGGEAAAEARKKAAKAKPKGPSVELDEMALADAKKRAAAKDDAQDDEDEPDEAAAKDKAGNPRHDPTARVQQATRKAKEAEERAVRAERERESERRERERLARENEDLRAGRQPAGREERRDDRAARDDGRPKPPAAPVLDDYLKQHERYEDGMAAYLDARDEHRDREKAVKVDRETRAHQHATTVVKTVEAFHQRMSEAVKADPALMETAADFASTLRPSFSREEGEQLAQHHVIADHIVKSEHAPALLRHFAADGGQEGPEFQRIAALRTPTEIRLALAKLEGRLEAATGDTSTRREVSRASSPGRSLSGSPQTADPDLSNVDFETHMSRKRARA